MRALKSDHGPACLRFADRELGARAAYLNGAGATQQVERLKSDMTDGKEGPQVTMFVRHGEKPGDPRLRRFTATLHADREWEHDEWHFASGNSSSSLRAFDGI